MTIRTGCVCTGMSGAAPESPRWLASKGQMAEATEASNKVSSALPSKLKPDQGLCLANLLCQSSLMAAL